MSKKKSHVYCKSNWSKISFCVLQITKHQNQALNSLPSSRSATSICITRISSSYKICPVEIEVILRIIFTSKVLVTKWQSIRYRVRFEHQIPFFRALQPNSFCIWWHSFSCRHQSISVSLGWSIRLESQTLPIVLWPLHFSYSIHCTCQENRSERRYRSLKLNIWPLLWWNPSMKYNRSLTPRNSVIERP